ncbi:hypothetical protein ACE6H2_024032 [Prunus campanulata]
MRLKRMEEVWFSRLPVDEWMKIEGLLDPRFPLLSCKNIHSEEKEKRDWNWNKDSDLMEKRPLIASTPLFLKSAKALSLLKLSVETLSPCLAPFVFSRCQQRPFKIFRLHRGKGHVVFWRKYFNLVRKRKQGSRLMMHLKWRLGSAESNNLDFVRQFYEKEREREREAWVVWEQRWLSLRLGWLYGGLQRR